jgi:predicted phosphoribosyltransferase
MVKDAMASIPLSAPAPLAGAQPILIPPLGLPGRFVCPAEASALVLVAAIGWPERRGGEIERFLAALQAAGLATLVFDMLTPAEAADPTITYDLRLMGERIAAARQAARTVPALADLPVCLLGFANGVAAALQYAVQPEAALIAIAGCGGRPDLARDALPRLRVPSLLVVGDRDEAVLDFNRAAFARIGCAKRLSEIGGVGPYLESAGAIEDAAAEIAAWFLEAARAQPKRAVIAAAPTRFADRAEAGRLLALRLLKFARQSPVVFALPRGGVPVAAEVAQALQAPLDVLIARKIGLPWEPELAVGAIAEGTPPEIVLNEDVLRVAGLTQDDIARLARVEMDEMVRRQALYRGGRKIGAVEGATAIVIDDGLATGATMRAALRSLARRRPARLVLAVPVAAPERLADVAREADETVCLQAPAGFRSVGEQYRDFAPVSDETVVALLARLRGAAPA